MPRRATSTHLLGNRSSQGLGLLKFNADAELGEARLNRNRILIPVVLVMLVALAS